MPSSILAPPVARGFGINRLESGGDRLWSPSPERIEKALRDKEFGEWPEVRDSKKETFDRHDEKLKSLHEYFKIPMKKKNK